MTLDLETAVDGLLPEFLTKKKKLCLFINPSLSVSETEDGTEALKNMKSRSGERNRVFQHLDLAQPEGHTGTTHFPFYSAQFDVCC